MAEPRDPLAAIQRRVDNVVRGLLSLGVRQGEHVGVLMSTRPSGLSVVAALNRLGAIAEARKPRRPGRRKKQPVPICRALITFGVTLMSQT